MKSLSFRVLASTLFFFPFLLYAQVDIIQVADLYIERIEVVEQTPAAASFLVTTKNGSTAQSDLRYILNVYDGDQVVDNFVHPSKVSIARNSTDTQLLTYTPPGDLDGTYQFALEVRGENGFPLAFSPIGETVQFTPFSNLEPSDLVDESRLVSIDQGTCVVTKQAEGEVLGTYGLSDQVAVGAGEELLLGCTVSNNSTIDPQTIIPSMTVYADYQGGAEIIPLTTDPSRTIRLTAGEETEFEIPLIISREPASFVTEFTFVNENEVQVSNDVSIAHTGYGLQAEVLNVSLNQDFYATNEDIDVSFTLAMQSQTPDTAAEVAGESLLDDSRVVVEVISSIDGALCATETISPVESGVQTVSIRSQSDCRNPEVQLIVFEGVDVITSEGVVTQSTNSTTTSATAEVSIARVVAAIGVILLLVLLFFVRRHRSSNKYEDINASNPLLLLFCLAAISLFTPGAVVQAESVIAGNYFVTYDVAESGGNIYPNISVTDLNDKFRKVNYNASVAVFDADNNEVTQVLLQPYFSNIRNTMLATPLPGTYRFEFTVENLYPDPFSLALTRTYTGSPADGSGDAAAKLPDLQSVNFQVPSEVMVGEMFSIRSNVRNVSNITATTSFATSFTYEFLGVETVLDVSNRSSLQRYTQYKESVDDVVLSSPGTYIFTHCVDPGMALPESDDTNNCQVRSLTVVPAAAPTVTFSVDRDFVRPGETTTLTWSTENADTCVLTSEDGTGLKANQVYDNVIVPTQQPGYLTDPFPRSQTLTLSCDSPLLGIPSATATVDVKVNLIANPPLLNSCSGIDLAIVTDVSGSISTSELKQVNEGLVTLIESIETDTVYSFTNFGTKASVIKDFSLNQTEAVDYLNSITGDGSGMTNWEQGLLRANSTFDPRPDRQNVILFASDGLPNRYGPSGKSASEGAAISYAVAAGNLIKDQGTPIFVVGIGGGLKGASNLANLEAISGPDAVILSTFDNVGDVLNSTLSGDFCKEITNCSNPVSNASLLSSSETADITGSVEWTYSPVNTAAKCEFVCNSGYYWDTTSELCLRQANGNLLINGSDDPAMVNSGEEVLLTWNASDVVEELTCQIVSLDGGSTVLQSGVANNSTGLLTDKLSGGLSGREYSFLFTCDGVIIDTEIIDVAPGNPTDLVADLDATASSDFNIETGFRNSVNLNYSIANFGEMDAGPFTNYLTLDMLLDGSIDETKLDDTYTDAGLAGGGVSTAIASVSIVPSGGLPPGAHNLCVTADFDGTTGVVPEDNEGNNTACDIIETTFVDPGISITTIPNEFVGTNGSIDVIWDLNGAGYIEECVVQGFGIDGADELVYSMNTGPRSGTLKDIGPITNKSEYTLTCTAVDLTTVFNALAIIDAIGEVQEI